MQIQNSIIIHAPTAIVWEALTHPGMMKAWMGDPEMNIEVITDWKTGSPVTIKAFHHLLFENHGTVLQFEPEKILRYNYLSSLSNLPDKPENYTDIKFSLSSAGGQTQLIVTLTNFPTDTIYKHLELYWRSTLNVLKTLVETRMA
jgi:uncharacterized protein YndB with AHSA1/START domain